MSMPACDLLPPSRGSPKRGRTSATLTPSTGISRTAGGDPSGSDAVTAAGDPSGSDAVPSVGEPSWSEAAAVSDVPSRGAPSVSTARASVSGSAGAPGWGGAFSRDAAATTASMSGKADLTRTTYRGRYPEPVVRV